MQKIEMEPHVPEEKQVKPSGQSRNKMGNKNIYTSLKEQRSYNNSRIRSAVMGVSSVRN